MSITADLIRGHTDTIILAKLMEHDSYGYEINKEIYNASNKKYELKEVFEAYKKMLKENKYTIIKEVKGYEEIWKTNVFS